MSTLNGKMFVVAAALVAAVGCVTEEDVGDQADPAEASQVEGAEAEDVSADETQGEGEAKPNTSAEDTPATQDESE